jgi:hypothetical protein
MNKWMMDRQTDRRAAGRQADRQIDKLLKRESLNINPDISVSKTVFK